MLDFIVNTLKIYQVILLVDYDFNVACKHEKASHSIELKKAIFLNLSIYLYCLNASYMYIYLLFINFFDLCLFPFLFFFVVFFCCCWFHFPNCFLYVFLLYLHFFSCLSLSKEVRNEDIEPLLILAFCNLKKNFFFLFFPFPPLVLLITGSSSFYLTVHFSCMSC